MEHINTLCVLKAVYLVFRQVVLIGITALVNLITASK
jgi:hypothetical protein